MTLENVSSLAILGFVSIIISLILVTNAYVAILKGKLKLHKWFMGTAAISNSVFLILYLTRLFTEGSTPFDGSNFMLKYVYLPILVVHVMTALLSIYFVGKQLYIGLFKLMTTDTGELYFKEPYRMMHIINGRRALVIWFLSFVGGITVFTLLYLI
ncbi:MAG: DUF420 domain-containing protein [Candidatus Heimdallarchaeota archaeon]|nr:DUF420 domain-containing protein [Candidatus Heimdallarchaeota archaeon]